MPVQVTYPGVYIEEIPSGVQTITGVATSITAFMGTALCGPLGTSASGPTTIFGFADYQRIFGGLWANSPMSYAVRDFFANGGGQAIIVRLYEPAASSPPEYSGYAVLSVDAPLPPPASPPASDDWSPASPPSSTLTLYAASPGAWGNRIRAMADTNLITPKVAAIYSDYGVQQADMFNLTVMYSPPGGPMQIERYTNLTAHDYKGFPPNPNRVDRILNQQSQLVQLPADEFPRDLELPAEWFTEWNTFNNSPNLENYNQNQVYELLDPATGGDDGNLVLSETAYTDPTIGGLYALDKVDLFNLLCIPYDVGNPDSNPDAEQQAMLAYPYLAAYCQKRRAMFIVDPPYSPGGKDWQTFAKNYEWGNFDPSALGIEGDEERNAAVYFPRVVEADPLLKGMSRIMPACGIIAGVMASTDVSRGVWKAPAGIAAGLNGILSLDINMTDDQNGLLNPLGINCLRSFPVIGPVVWGARTLRGADQLEDDYKYIPVRRLTLYIEESLYRGTKWAVFEPNADPLWTSLRLSVNSFLSDLQRQGAFYSYFVQCDSKTTTPDDIALGIVNVIVGIAPVKPAEFVIIQIQQTAGQTS
jgi:phage tail sheath protein FI